MSEPERWQDVEVPAGLTGEERGAKFNQMIRLRHANSTKVACGNIEFYFPDDLFEKVGLPIPTENTLMVFDDFLALYSANLHDQIDMATALTHKALH